MNKSELIDEVHKLLGPGSARTAAETAVSSLLTALENGLLKDGVVQVVGFGTFTVKDRAARVGRNPRTGEEVQIKASRTVGFRTGSQLKRRLQQ